MSSVKNLSLRKKLFFISIIPLLALLYFVFSTVYSELERKRIVVQVYNEFAEIEQMSRLLHELQIERGLVTAYLVSNSIIDKKAMVDQQKSTNAIVFDVQNIFQKHHKASTILPFLDSLSSYREVSKTYTDRINNYKALLLSEMSKTLRTSRNPIIRNHLESHVFLLYSKEYFAQLRTVLTYAIESKRFARGEYSNFALLKGAVERNFFKFNETAPENIKAFADKKLNVQSRYIASSILDSLFYNPDVLAKLHRNDWWENSTKTIEHIKEIEDHSLEYVKQIAESELKAINKTVYTSILVVVSIVILIIALILYTIRQIVLSISTITEAAEKITNGEVDVQVPSSTQDEIGALASSFNKMISVSRKYASAADAIGKGDYKVDVPVRGSSDVLGIALNQMKTNLQKLAHENEVRTWLLTGNNVLNDSMRGDKQLGRLAEDIINELSIYLSAQIGAVYIRNNGHLQLSGSYAFDSAYQKHIFQMGEGLIGQAAINGKPILFNEVPEDYIRINSALGQTKPRNVLVYPFEYEGEVKGIIEVAAVKEFSQVELELLAMVSNNIGIAVHAAQGRERLKQLLEETQRQAEELESQQEELRQFNEELQDKTELLGRSEEELRAQQEELQQTNEELGEKASLLEAQKQALESAKMQIEEKVIELEIVSKYKSEFLANMSHELRTPLNSILILTQVLMDNKNKSLSEKEVQYVSTIHHSGHDLLNLINQILDLSKIEAGKMEMDVEDFTIESVIKNIHTTFDDLARSRSIEFTILASESIRTTMIQSDSQRVEQILKNFLANAFKFTDLGGKVTLKIDNPGRLIQFKSDTLKEAEKIISFSVNDNGIGIPKEKFDLIFEAFQQVDGSTKRKYGGTGLGLSICRELSYLLGGEIHFESQEQKGSTFTLYLPVSLDLNENNFKPTRSTSEPVQAIMSKSTKDVLLSHSTQINDDRFVMKDSDKKILIIEDDVQFSSVLLGFVRDRHYKGIIAGDGSTGLFYARQYKPDAIFLDLNLPLMSGDEVLRQLKTDPELRHIPVQIITGYGLRNDGLRQGALDFINKPINKEDITKALDRIEDFVSRKTKQLLIVEDDFQHNMAVKELVSSEDVNCNSAYSGKEGYSLLTKNSYDCVILDIGLPDMSGFEFLEQIRHNEKLNKIPIIVYTGKTLSKEENSKLEKLADSVVIKTVHSHERLLDETALFLHRVESTMPKEKKKIIRKLHKTEEVLKNKTVLIADDDVRNLFSCVTVLEQEGMNCITVENGKQAVEAMSNNPSIQIVLMDVMMPEMDGYEATREIRKNTANKNLPIIALTAKAMKGDREKCIEAGMSDYISKPLNVQQLLSLMRVWLYS